MKVTVPQSRQLSSEAPFCGHQHGSGPRRPPHLGEKPESRSDPAPGSSCWGVRGALSLQPASGVFITAGGVLSWRQAWGPAALNFRRSSRSQPAGRGDRKMGTKHTGCWGESVIVPQRQDKPGTVSEGDARHCPESLMQVSKDD